ncbi:putative DNA topoisomerase [Helianthus anomalus]
MLYRASTPCAGHAPPRRYTVCRTCFAAQVHCCQTYFAAAGNLTERVHCVLDMLCRASTPCAGHALSRRYTACQICSAAQLQRVPDMLCRAGKRRLAWKTRLKGLYIDYYTGKSKTAAKNHKKFNTSLSDVASMRREMDLRAGASFTRFQTLEVGNKFIFPSVDKDDHVLIYGSCLFPALGFVVERSRETHENAFPVYTSCLTVSGTARAVTLERTKTNERAPNLAPEHN